MNPSLVDDILNFKDVRFLSLLIALERDSAPSSSIKLLSRNNSKDNKFLS